MDHRRPWYAYALKYSVIFGVLVVFFAWTGVNNAARNRQYHDSESVPYNRVALVLGTSQFTRTGGPNRFFWHRMDAAASLYHAGKAGIIIASGDNRFASYNEPESMRRALVSLGVPDHVIVLDASGFSTFDSVVRSARVFGAESITIVSQEFHTARAIFIARNNGIEAVGFTAADVPREDAFATYVREYFARIKALIDVYVLRREPRVMDEPVDLEELVRFQETQEPR
ncbi:MAG: vancomycin high temperature exclusion protein [Spirochaetaceae bacterium]